MSTMDSGSLETSGETPSASETTKAVAADGVGSPRAQPVAVVNDEEWTSLDPAIRTVWRLNALIGTGILLAPAVAGFIVGALKDTGAVRAWALVVGCLVGFAGLALTVWYPARLYAVTAYRRKEAVFLHRRGVVWQTTVAIPLNRLQHVDLHRGPLDRALGIATLRLYTAGTRNAVHELTGIRDELARGLRDRLLAERERPASQSSS